MGPLRVNDPVPMISAWKLHILRWLILLSPAKDTHHSILFQGEGEGEIKTREGVEGGGEREGGERRAGRIEEAESEGKEERRLERQKKKEE